jgi:hypothetical protein
MGGGRPAQFVLNAALLENHVVPHEKCGPIDINAQYRFVKYAVNTQMAEMDIGDSENYIVCRFMLSEASRWMKNPECINIAKIHGINLPKKAPRERIDSVFQEHMCNTCTRHVCIFEKVRKDIEPQNYNSKRSISNETPFPPPPPSKELIRKIINGFCADSDPSELEEAGCAVCGQLCRLKNLLSLSKYQHSLDILKVPNVTRRERRTAVDPIIDIDGPVLDNSCSQICSECASSLEKGKIPRYALANNLWIGDIPHELQGLSFAETMMIARIRHNKCLVRVSSGWSKMTSNVIMYSNPTVKVYHALPPPKEELDDVLAFIFTGPAQPTDEDFKRSPMLVRRQKVLKALEWLKLNHRDYADLQISRQNLASYPLEGVPVNVIFKKTSGDSNREASTMSVYDDDVEEGTSHGPCPITVHGLSGTDYGTATIDILKARALSHLENEGKILAIGHDSCPQSMYDNPQAYPQMFPWLFPYGFGGIGQPSLKNKISELQHKRLLLMYHDKRFQHDLYFPIIAFNHEQLKGGVTGSFLVAKRQNFHDISSRLMSVNKSVLQDITTRLASGDTFKPQTDEEKACFAIIEDLDHVGGFVKGSLTSKKYMRNELWSMLAYIGAPSWFITLSPADNRHPISLYYADGNILFKPEILTQTARYRLMANNPVAAARFFHLVVQLFIKHVLGVDNETPGLYGKTSAYYGTVEQQGRLTLHLHMLLWIANALSPQEIRDRIMNKDSAFQLALIEYLEGVHKGEFLTDSLENLKEKIPYVPPEEEGVHSILKNAAEGQPENTSYQDPTLTLPIPMPPECDARCPENEQSCDRCINNKAWCDQFASTVDDIILRSNVHSCKISADAFSKDDGKTDSDKSSKQKKPKGPKGCLDRNGICRARFPRPVYQETTVDNTDGHIFIKKLEPMVNNYSPVLSYLTRSNTDVTSLLSGTSIKAIVSYITDYISKPALKTYQLFGSMYDVFEKQSESGLPLPLERSDGARRLLLKLINSLSSKMEIGSPMASMYLLGHPDHYTSHEFVPFWWRMYVNEVKRYWEPAVQYCADVENLDDAEEHSTQDNVILTKHDGQYVGSSNVDDYKYRPDKYSHMSLLDWVQAAVRRKRPKSRQNQHGQAKDNDGDIDMADEQELKDDQPTAYTGKYVAFQDQHPLAATHWVTCNTERINKVIPNILGGPLPRCDQGDRENYCCTMLTLFKPWRAGHDLKTNMQTWEDAFNSYQFTERQRKLMKNFNLRYECLDTRDDFHAELKKREAEIRRNVNSYGDYVGEDYDDQEMDDFVQTLVDEDNNYEAFGPSYKKEIKQKQEVDTILTSARWLDANRNINPNFGQPFSPEFRLPHTAWANVVKTERDKLFKKKMSAYIPPPDDDQQTKSRATANDVRIVSADYLLKSYKAKNAEHSKIVEDTIRMFSLNEEQERAFRIIANHASSLAPEPLRMYLGGIGGTGKSQLLKAVSRMFNARNESHRFLIVGPTGTSASLLGGHTFHRALGIYSRTEKGADYSRNESAVINEVRSRLQGLEYVFIDEVSMISCRDLFAISKRLSQVFNIDSLFGNRNIIAAGDFAQLPPVGEQPFFSSKVRNRQDPSMKPRDQEATLGKIFWHQFTTVVILKKNMRQKEQSNADARLRTALENMRYKDCTYDDIAFLNSRVVDKVDKDLFKDPRFRNVAVITAWNSQKDRFNEQGSARFAADHGQQLTHFYSIDSLGVQDENSSKKKKNTGRVRGRRPRIMSKALQNALWARSPCSSEGVAAKLSLCKGMPVMIRNNDATELCITKGQEATVVGWESSEGPFQKPVLDTLFVKLTNPPQEVNLPNLPTNVVPLTRTSTRVVCTLKSGVKVNVQRQQVLVLPNFAMTDYASQGKTRPFNVVHLEHCKDHASYYTCLSRSASAEGTILLGPVDPKKITGGISGYLRQEFRELNILDEITRLNYEGLLPEGILQPLRNPTIRAFVQWNKSRSYENDWHPALAYKDGESRLKPIEDDGTWNAKVNLAFNPPKRKKKDTSHAPISPDQPEPDAKRLHLETIQPPTSNSPPGMLWDRVNYSCAYDSTFTVIHNIWSRNPVVWYRRLAEISHNLELLCDGFNLVDSGLSSLEFVRNFVRDNMHHTNPDRHPRGSRLTAISHVIEAITPPRTCGTSTLICELCGYRNQHPLLYFGEYITLTSTGRFHDNSENTSRVSDVLGWQLNHRQRRSGADCPECLTRQNVSKLQVSISFARIPYLVIVELSMPRYIIDHEINYEDTNFSFKLAGVIYGGQDHFVCRIIDSAQTIWYHDGITTGNGCERECTLSDISGNPSWLRTADKNGSVKHALYAFYIRD